MKRYYALLIPVVLLAGCTSTKKDGPNAAGPEPSASAATGIAAPDKASKPYKITFIQGVAGDEFYITMQCGIQAEAARLGVTVQTQGPQKFDPTLQKPILDAAVASKPDAILIAPTDVKAMQQPLEQAAAAGIKIVRPRRSPRTTSAAGRRPSTRSRPWSRAAAR
jgi:ribose transport system substrate-binding protein